MLVIESEELSIALIHIPKTGGTTLRHLLQKCLISANYSVVHRSITRCSSPIRKRRSMSLNESEMRHSSHTSSENFDPGDNTSHPPKLHIVAPDIITSISDPVSPNTNSPRAICHGYWSNYDGVDLAHVPYRYFQEYYPPDNPGSIPLNVSKYTWITSVRNPYDRIYSAYCWHTSQNNIDNTLESFNIFVLHELPKIVTDFFVDFAVGIPPKDKYIHFIPMWMMLTDEKGHILKANYILRQETFNTDLITLFKGLKLPLPSRYSNSHCTNKNPPPIYSYLSNYSYSGLQIIETLYEKDFKYFGYQRLLDL